jgi:hypothetical protein
MKETKIISDDKNSMQQKNRQKMAAFFNFSIVFIQYTGCAGDEFNRFQKGTADRTYPVK